MSYTVLAVAGIGLAVVLDVLVLRTRVVTRRAFWTSYAIVVCFQLLTNGWLTGRDIVTYDESQVLGPRLAFAPVEDVLFGFSLVVQTLAWWVWWGRPRGSRRTTSAAGADDGGERDAQPT